MKVILIRKNYGFSLLEMLVSMAILSIILTGVFLSMNVGSSSWTQTNNQIQTQESLRIVINKLARELRESGVDANGNMMVTVVDGGGASGSDILSFRMPIYCEANGTVVDSNGDVNNWGAPLTWGCNDESCMDADSDCATVDYDRVEYLVGNNNQLIRRVVGPAPSNNVIRTDVFAENISDFQVTGCISNVANANNFKTSESFGYLSMNGAGTTLTSNYTNFASTMATDNCKVRVSGDATSSWNQGIYAITGFTDTSNLSIESNATSGSAAINGTAIVGESRVNLQISATNGDTTTVLTSNVMLRNF